MLVLPGARKQKTEQKQSWERAGNVLRSRMSWWGHPEEAPALFLFVYHREQSMWSLCHPCWSVFPLKGQTWSSAGGGLSCCKHEEGRKGEA